MKLYQLLPDFTTLSAIERTEFIRAYRERRALELESSFNNKKKTNKIVLSEEEKQLIKVLGVSQKTLMDLKRSISSE